MGIGGSKPESSDGGVIQAGLNPVRRRFEEIRRRRKNLQHRDSIVSTTELLPASADDSSSSAGAAPSDVHKAEAVLVAVPESDVLMAETMEQLDGDGEKNRGRDSDAETLPRLSVVVKRDEIGAGEENDLFYGRDQMPKSPSFRHLAEIDSHLDHSDDSGNTEDHQGKVSTEGRSASTRRKEIKKKKGRKLPSFAKGPAVCGLLHVQSCYSIPDDSPRTKPPAPDHQSPQEKDQIKSSEKTA